MRLCLVAQATATVRRLGPVVVHQAEDFATTAGVFLREDAAQVDLGVLERAAEQLGIQWTDLSQS